MNQLIAYTIIPNDTVLYSCITCQDYYAVYSAVYYVTSEGYDSAMIGIDSAIFYHGYHNGFTTTYHIAPISY